MTPRRRTLDRFLSRAGVASREEAARAISAGRVSVNDTVIQDPETWIDPDRDRVRLDGQRVVLSTHVALVIQNKPRGVVSTLSDPEGRTTVRDALPERFRSDRSLRPVGRLDRASAGLLLWTNDTDLADRLLSPEGKVEKEYRVKVRPAPDEETLGRWRHGVDIGDPTPTAPAEVAVERVSPRSAVVRFVLGEGRNRQIRRMVGATGGTVEWLVRVRFGVVDLAELPPGEAREATAEERSALGAPASEFSDD